MEHESIGTKEACRKVDSTIIIIIIENIIMVDQTIMARIVPFLIVVNQCVCVCVCECK